jgi:hypothetical protein
MSAVCEINEKTLIELACSGAPGLSYRHRLSSASMVHDVMLHSALRVSTGEESTLGKLPKQHEVRMDDWFAIFS